MTHAPPKARRWRLKVVLVAVVFSISLISWWHWPRGDARFVGKWRAFAMSTVSVWELSANGEGLVTDQGGASQNFS